MISCERWKDGFVLTVEGLRLLRHSSSFPAIFLGNPKEKAESAGQGGDESVRNLKWKSIGACGILNEGPDSIVLDFPSTLRIRISYADRILSLDFSPVGPAAQGIRLRVGARPAERLFGAGPSTQYDMKKKRIELEEEEGDPLSRRNPTIMSSSGSWIHVEGKGSFLWNFSSALTELSCSAIPDGLTLGFGRDLAMGLDLLTGCKAGGRHGFPEAFHGGIVLDARGAPPEAAGLPDRMREWGIGLAAVIVDRDSGTAADPAGIRSQVWSDMLGAASARALPPGSGELGSASEFVRGILSLSFSGEGQVFLPVDEGSRGSDFSPACELAAFGPLFLLSASLVFSGEVSARRLAAAAAIYGGLEPYRRSCSLEWEKSGMPALMHPAVRYNEEEVLWHFDDQYMFGPDLLIAPTMGKGSRTRELRLPCDEWVHLWTSRLYPGGRTVVDAPPERPAVFYRSASPFASLFDALRQKATRY